MSFRPSSWPIVSLASVAEQIFVGLPISRYAPKADDQDAISVQILNVGSIEDGCIAAVDAIPETRLRLGDYERFRVRTGDVLVSCRGTILKAALVSDDNQGLLASSNLIVVRPVFSRIHPHIILAILRASPWQDELKSRTRSSAALMQFTAKDVADLQVPLPPYDLQTKLAALIEAEDRAYRSSLAAANARRSLVEMLTVRALTGRAEDDDA